MIRTAFAAAMLAALFGSTAASAALLDDFNRADAGTLGPNWTAQDGGAGISGNQAVGLSFGSSLATYNGGSGNAVSFDIQNVGSDTGFAAAVLGYGAGTNIFVKVQNNGGSTGFDSYGFYTGNNSVVSFNALNTTFQSGHIDVSFLGTIATLTITPTAGAVQTYQYDYGFGLVGTGIGLGFFGATLVDNFGDGAAVAPGVPEPASWAMMIGGFALAGAALRRRKAVVRFA